MDNNKLNVSDELLQNLTIDEIAEMKIEVDDLADRLNNIINACNVMLKK